MSIQTLVNEEVTREFGDFYVPAYEIMIEGAGLPNNILRDITQVTYKDSEKGIDSFEISLNNWDDETRSLKYIEPDRSEVPEGVDRQRYTTFEPCGKEVKISLGYSGALRVMLTGNVTTISPSYQRNASPSLKVRGLNVLHKLRTRQNTRTWRDKKDSEIVKSMESTLPLPVEINRTAQNEESPLEFVAQRNLYDIDFIMSRARINGYSVFIQEPDPNVSGSEHRLYFGPSEDAPVPGLRDVTYELHYGKTLVDFTPTLTTANQVRSVTVRGWSRNNRSTVTGTATLNDLNRNRDLFDLLDSCDPREEIVVDRPVFTRQEARREARQILSRRQKDMVKASGTVIGLPDLRSGKNIRIKGVGKRFSGTYFITETTHTINSSGYMTTFQARREDEEGS